MAVAALCKLKIALFLWVCLVAPSVLANGVKYCDKKGNYDVKVTKVDIKPNPVKAGEPAEFKIFASSGQDISEGEVVIDVSYFGVHVHNEKIDLCRETYCPLSVGNFVLSHNQTLPSFTPPGSYTLKMQIKDANDKLLTCISFGFKIGFGSSVSDI